jgi:hypothetical protein
MSSNQEAEPSNLNPDTRAKVNALSAKLHTHLPIIQVEDLAHNIGFEELMQDIRDAIGCLSRYAQTLPDTPNPASSTGEPPQVR